MSRTIRHYDELQQRHAMHARTAREARAAYDSAPSAFCDVPRALRGRDVAALGLALWRDERGAVAPHDALLGVLTLGVLAVGALHALCAAIDGARARFTYRAPRESHIRRNARLAHARRTAQRSER